MTTQVTEAKNRAQSLVKLLRDQSNLPSDIRSLDRRWTQVEVAKLIGRSNSYISTKREQWLADGVISPFDPEDKGIARWRLDQIRALQRHHNSGPWRHPELDRPLILGFQNFKGGVGKSTQAVIAAQWLVTKGYRVLLVDGDPQASATSMFGLLPDHDVGEHETIVPFFNGDKDDLRYAIRKTYWDGLDLIPTNLVSYELEWGIAQQMLTAQSKEERDALTELLRDGLDTVKDQYDIILVDSPPSLGTLSFNILKAVDALLIPTPARVLDFTSTAQYLSMVDRVLGEIRQEPFAFFGFVSTLYEGRIISGKENTQQWLNSLMQEAFGDNMLREPMRRVKAVENAVSELKSVLEERRPDSSVMEMVDGWMEEIELLIMSTWRSKATAVHERRQAMLEKRIERKESE